MSWKRTEGSTEKPIYAKLLQGGESATHLYMITVDEGWRTSIVCTDMYEEVADWLLGVLAGQPYVTHGRH